MALTPDSPMIPKIPEETQIKPENPSPFEPRENLPVKSEVTEEKPDLSTNQPGTTKPKSIQETPITPEKQLAPAEPIISQDEGEVVGAELNKNIDNIRDANEMSKIISGLQKK